MADKWDRSIKDDFKRAHDGNTAPPREPKSATTFKNDKLDHPADGPKFPDGPKRPAPSPAPGRSMGQGPVSAPQKAQGIHARWDSADTNRKPAKDFSLKKEFNGKAR